MLQKAVNIYKIYKGGQMPTTFLVVPHERLPENLVPFNLLYLFGEMTLVRGAITSSYLPFARGGQKKIASIVEDKGYCFYKWPGKILGDTLGDVLELDEPLP